MLTNNLIKRWKRVDLLHYLALGGGAGSKIVAIKVKTAEISQKMQQFDSGIDMIDHSNFLHHSLIAAFSITLCILSHQSILNNVEVDVS